LRIYVWELVCAVYTTLDGRREKEVHIQYLYYTCMFVSDFVNKLKSYFINQYFIRVIL